MDRDPGRARLPAERVLGVVVLALMLAVLVTWITWVCHQQSRERRIVETKRSVRLADHCPTAVAERLT